MLKRRVIVRTPRNIHRTPQFADPWSFRQSRRRGEGVAALDGRPLAGDTYRRNGRLHHAGHVDDPLVPRPVDPPERSMLTELRRRLAKRIAEHRLSGLFSEVDIEIMDNAIRGTQTLREIGEIYGCSRQAVWERIQKLMNRSAFFRTCWQRRNLMRGRRSGQ
jgi:hypothetical protein